MNILILCKKVPYPPTDGEAIVIASDIDTLSQLGHQIFLGCINTKKHYKTVENIPSSGLFKQVFSTTIDTFSSFNLAKALFFRHAPFHLARFYSKDFLEQIHTCVQEHKIDMILCQGLPMCLYISKIKQQTTLPIIYRAHNIEYKIWDEMASISSSIWEKIIYTWIKKSLFQYESTQLALCDSIITLKPSETAFFNNIYAMPIYTVQISLKVPDTTTEYNPEAEGLLFIGSLDWLPNRQGMDWFIKEIHPHISHIPLTIAGRGKYKPFSATGNIKIIENFTSLESLMSTHRLMIVPLLSGAGIRIKILEAMQYGMPTLSTSLGAEGIESNAIGIANTIDQFIDSINTLYYDIETLSQFSKKIKQNYSQQYTLEAIKSHWENAITTYTTP